MRSARAAAVVTWVYAAAFGLPAVPVSVFLLRNGRLPSFLGLFDSYGGPWSSAFQFDPDEFVRLLLTFLVLTVLASATAWLVWRGSREGAVLSLMLLPVEAAFWNGFALPIPWLIGVARVVLLVVAWRSLTWSLLGVPAARARVSP
jgi:hypothetical protein